MKHGDAHRYINKLTPTNIATQEIVSLKKKVQSIIRISKKPKKSFEQALIQQKLFES